MFRKQYTTSNPAVSSDISSQDTSKNTSMSRMFANTDFNQDISNWDTGEVTNMYNAFQNAWEFEKKHNNEENHKDGSLHCFIQFKKASLRVSVVEKDEKIKRRIKK